MSVLPSPIRGGSGLACAGGNVDSAVGAHWSPVKGILRPRQDVSRPYADLDDVELLDARVSRQSRGCSPRTGRSADRAPLLHLIVGVELSAALHSAGLTAGFAYQGLLAAFVMLPLLALLVAVLVSRLLLVPWIVFGRCGLTATASPGGRGWWVTGCRHRGSCR